jgi:hypothetical protein
VSPAHKKASRKERLAADPSCVAHGVWSTYRNWGCRCVPCVHVNTVCMAETRRKLRERLAADFTAAVHGQNSTYLNWGCRCVPCREAHAEAGRR